MAPSVEVDSVEPDAKIVRIGFGSCSNQHRQRALLKPTYARLEKEKFDLFVWGGDVVYTRGPGLDHLKKAYEELKEEGSYDHFAQSVPRVIGTWDDHDLGINDGGSSSPNLRERQSMFLDFLNVPADSKRRTRNGVYSAHDFGSGEESVRVIMLDTRSGRSEYAFGFLGTIGGGTSLGKIFPLLAASARSFFGLTGLSARLASYRISNHQMLDEAQWSWLEHQFISSSAEVNILVSSVQVLSQNPSVESWGHFPIERQRLLALINKTKPKGFLILSGDVHIGIANSLNELNNFPVPEVTSSGLTHTCTAGGIPHVLCAFVWNLFEPEERRNAMILSRNYGSIDIDWRNKEMKVGVHSLTENATVSFKRSFQPLPDFDPNEIQGIVSPHNVAILASLFLAFVLVCRLIVHVAMKKPTKLANRTI